ncbi:MAG: methyltransferase domain-containing protein [Candidatus Latescibacteria bacterium]|nr:methyltransferase domain-containing protein [Candidatus Latescibacterota bacterium]
MEYTDYKVHYQVDAEYIVPPEELPAMQRASEKRRLQTIIRTITTRPGGQVLDIGCGSGWLAGMLRRQGNQVVAMDISPAGVQKAKRWIVDSRQQTADSRRQTWGMKGDLNFVTADIYDLPFPDTSFRWVILSEVMEHLHNPDQALHEVHRVLERGGRVVITVPHRERIRYTLCIHCNRTTPVNAHLWSFTKEDVETLVVTQGFTPVKVEELSNRILEYFRFPWITRWAPYSFWCLVNSLVNRLSRGAYLCIVAEKLDR